MSRASIANIESGRQNVLLHNAYGLAEALGFSEVAELLPAMPRTSGRASFDTPVSGAAVTAQDRMQINELLNAAMATRSRAEERRGGKGGVSKCRSRWSPY